MNTIIIVIPVLWAMSLFLAYNIGKKQGINRNLEVIKKLTETISKAETDRAISPKEHVAIREAVVEGEEIIEQSEPI